MKKYEEPKMKLHELKTKTAMLQASSNTPVVVQETKAIVVDNAEGDATEGFGTIDGWE